MNQPRCASLAFDGRPCRACSRRPTRTPARCSPGAPCSTQLAAPPRLNARVERTTARAPDAPSPQRRPLSPRRVASRLNCRVPNTPPAPRPGTPSNQRPVHPSPRTRNPVPSLTRPRLRCGAGASRSAAAGPRTEPRQVSVAPPCQPPAHRPSRTRTRLWTSAMWRWRSVGEACDRPACAPGSCAGSQRVASWNV